MAPSPTKGGKCGALCYRPSQMSRHLINVRLVQDRVTEIQAEAPHKIQKANQKMHTRGNS